MIHKLTLSFANVIDPYDDEFYNFIEDDENNYQFFLSTIENFFDTFKNDNLSSYWLSIPECDQKIHDFVKKIAMNDNPAVIQVASIIDSYVFSWSCKRYHITNICSDIENLKKDLLQTREKSVKKCFLIALSLNDGNLKCLTKNKLFDRNIINIIF